MITCRCPQSKTAPTAEESFHGMLRGLLWGSLGLFVILQLPWITELLIQRTDIDVSIWCRILQKLTPLCALVAFGIIMLCAYMGIILSYRLFTGSETKEIPVGYGFLSFGISIP